MLIFVFRGVFYYNFLFVGFFFCSNPISRPISMFVSLIVLLFHFKLEIQMIFMGWYGLDCILDFICEEFSCVWYLPVCLFHFINLFLYLQFVFSYASLTKFQEEKKLEEHIYFFSLNFSLSISASFHIFVAVCVYISVFPVHLYFSMYIIYFIIMILFGFI